MAPNVLFSLLAYSSDTNLPCLLFPMPDAPFQRSLPLGVTTTPQSSSLEPNLGSHSVCHKNTMYTIKCLRAGI